MQQKHKQSDNKATKNKIIKRQQQTRALQKGINKNHKQQSTNKHKQQTKPKQTTTTDNKQ